MKRGVWHKTGDFAGQAWRRMNDISSRMIFLTVLGFHLVHFALNWLLLGAHGPYGLFWSTGMALGVMLGSLAMAAVLALPGWLFRGSYNVRPMVIGLAISSMLLLFCRDILLPLSFASRLGVFWKMAALPLMFAGSFAATFAWLMTTFSHRWGRGITLTALILAVLGTATNARRDIFMERGKFLQKVFEMRDSNLVSMLGGRAVAPAQIAADFSSLEADFNKNKIKE